MDKGLIFENLLKIARKENVDIKICSLSANYGLLKGNRIALNNSMGIQSLNYTLAHELAHLYLHKDQGDTINSNIHEKYEKQADYSAKFLLHCLNSIEGANYECND